MNKWVCIADNQPPVDTEVLVWVDGHRGPSWSNNHALVAFMDQYGNFYEERHPGKPLDVLKWSFFETPSQSAEREWQEYRNHTEK